MAGRKPTPITERIRESTVIDGDGCWVWQKPLQNGYGRMWVGSRLDGSRRFALAHDASYRASVGPVPDGMVLDHLCRNRACCNPAHLETVTQRENVLRGIGPSAVNAQKTHCPHGHEFTPGNTRMNKGKRYCGECVTAGILARKDTREFKAREAQRAYAAEKTARIRAFYCPATLVATRTK